MHLRNFILFSDIRSFELALGIMPPAESLGAADALLLPLVAKGDENAMKQCIEAYGPLVWSIVCRRISHREEAEETCQDIFTEIWRVADRFDSEMSKESTFIGMITRRRSSIGKENKTVCHPYPPWKVCPKTREVPVLRCTPSTGLNFGPCCKNCLRIRWNCFPFTLKRASLTSKLPIIPKLRSAPSKPNCDAG